MMRTLRNHTLYQQFSWCDGDGGLQHNKICLETCLRYEEDGVTGHLYIHDDMYIDFTHLCSLPKTKLWFVAIPTVHETDENSGCRLGLLVLTNWI